MNNMRKVTFQYRVYPTKAQETILNAQLEECRWLYNHFLAEKKKEWRKSKKSLSAYDLMNTLPALKKERETLQIVNAQALTNVAIRVDLAFQAFFRRWRNGEKPGYPRFKSFHRYRSITFPQVIHRCYIRDGMLRVSKVGDVKIILHRPLEGNPKTVTLKKSTTGKWYVTFVCELNDPKPLKKSKNQIGIDIGLCSFAALSNGEKIANPRFFKRDEKELARVQRLFSKEAKGTTERIKRRKPVARVHERIEFRRKDFAHQQSRRIVNAYGFIAVEDLEVNRMIETRKFSKSISDASWAIFFTLLLYKAANAGRTIVRVNPAYTSQTCSSCGHRQKMPLDKRKYVCLECKLSLNRDVNAAINILTLGLQGSRKIGKAPTQVGE